MHTVSGLLLALAATAVLFTPTDAEAKIYKCIGGDGSVSYTQQPCPTSEQTSKIMDDKSAREHFDCRVARAFSTHVAKGMKEGQTADDMFSEYGGLNSIKPTTVSIINYVFSHKGNESTSVPRISALTGARCDSGSYSRDLDCEHFPPSFIESMGGCSAGKGESASANYRRSQEDTSDENRYGGLSQVRARTSASSEQNYNVLAVTEGEKQNDCRVAVREKISDLQNRMRGRLSLEVHDRLSEERRSLRDDYEAC